MFCTWAFDDFWPFFALRETCQKARENIFRVLEIKVKSAETSRPRLGLEVPNVLLPDVGDQPIFDTFDDFWRGPFPLPKGPKGIEILQARLKMSSEPAAKPYFCGEFCISSEIELFQSLAPFRWPFCFLGAFFCFKTPWYFLSVFCLFFRVFQGSRCEKDPWCFWRFPLAIFAKTKEKGQGS